MTRDLIQAANEINNPKFRVGDEVVLTEGPHKYLHGIFLGLQRDVKWASVKEDDGTVNSHPVEWIRSYEEPLCYTSLSGRSKE